MGTEWRARGLAHLKLFSKVVVTFISLHKQGLTGTVRLGSEIDDSRAAYEEQELCAWHVVFSKSSPDAVFLCGLSTLVFILHTAFMLHCKILGLRDFPL